MKRRFCMALLPISCLLIISMTYPVQATAFSPDYRRVHQMVDTHRLAEAYELLWEWQGEKLEESDKAKILRMLAEIEYFTGQNSALLEHGIGMLEIGAKQKDSYLEMLGYFYVSKVYYEMYNDKQGMDNLVKMYHLAEENDYPLGEAFFNHYMGLLYLSYGEADEAYHSIEKANDFYGRVEWDDVWLFGYYDDQGRFDREVLRISSFSPAFNLQKRVDDLQATYLGEDGYMDIIIYFQLGKFANQLDDYAKAVEYFESGLHLIDEYQISRLSDTRVRDNYQNLAISYVGLKEYKKASESFMVLMKEQQVKGQVEDVERKSDQLRALENKTIELNNQRKNRIIAGFSLLLFLLVVMLIVMLRIWRANQRLIAKIDQKATFDDLTATYNRAKIMDVFEQEKDGLLAMALIDADDFKQINDRYGHLSGDEVLKGISALTQQTLAGVAKVGRYGGEEFLILFTDDNEVSTADEMMVKAASALEELRVKIAELTWPFGDRRVTVSIGLTAGFKTDFDKMFKQADECLYIAKANGKNQIRHRLLEEDSPR